MIRVTTPMFLVASLLLLIAGRAQAQAACEEGRERSALTEGRCCWPGQTWANELGRCEGPPECPATRVAAGDECVPRAQTVARELAAPAVAWPDAGGAGPDGIRNAHFESRPDLALTITGATLFGLSWIAAIVMGEGYLHPYNAYHAGEPCGYTTAGNWMDVPVVGPWVALGFVRNCPDDYRLTFDTIVPIAVGTLELLGLALLIAGVVPREIIVEGSPEQSPVTLHLGPAPAGANLGGLSALLTF